MNLARRLALLIDDDEHDQVFTPQFLDWLRDHIAKKEAELEAQAQEPTGWFCYETVGVAVANPESIRRLDLFTRGEQSESVDQREALIREALNTPEGRQRLAEAMVAPIRNRIDYPGRLRDLLLVEELPPGPLPVYDRTDD